MKTYTAKQSEIQNNWYLVDATDKTLGRLASELAKRLRGKHKPEYTPFLDTGDHFVVINADKIKVTGNKKDDKMYHHHTGFPGGIRSINFSDLQDKKPGKVIEIAVKGMLPRGPLGRKMFSKLKVYAGQEHPHTAQKPEKIEI